MGRPARYIPENKDGVLVEVSCRCIGGRALLTPGPNPFKLNEIVAGVMGRALEISPLDLCCAIVSGNHYHLLAVVNEQQQLTRFMAHLGCNLSKEIGRLRRRRREEAQWRSCGGRREDPQSESLRATHTADQAIAQAAIPLRDARRA